MKYLVPLLSLIFLFISCKKDKDLTPTNTIDCTSIGLAEAHQKHLQFQGIIDNYVDQGFPGITALIYTPNEGLWVGSSGLADIKNKVGMNTCHAFYSGSVAKMYTVTAAMHMAEQGIFDLDDPIANYLPASLVSTLPNAQSATIRQLMNHTAGMPDHDDNQALSDYVDSHNGNLPSPVDQLNYLAGDNPLFTAGDSAIYSSAHTLTLAVILDKISGSSHADIITNAIINPLGLNETFYKNEIAYPNVKNLVNGYYGNAQSNDDISAQARNYCLGSHGDAGIIASANDYFLFMKNLMEGNIVNITTVQEMLQDYPLYDDGTYRLGFGLGLFVISQNGLTVKIGHGGVTGGGMSHVYYYPQEGAYIVVLTNTLAIEDPNLAPVWQGDIFVGNPNSNIMQNFENIIIP